MSKRKQTHVLRGSDRTCTAVITEHKNYVLFDLKMSPSGWGSEQDIEACDEWMKPLLERYDNDPRPLVIPHPTTGQIAVIGGDAQRRRLTVLTLVSL